MSSTEMPVSSAMNALNRAMSRQPAWPTMRLVGKPVTFHAVYTIASSGLLTTITMLPGAWAAICSLTLRTMATLVLIRSSRLMPGLRGTPAVSTTTSAPAMSA